MVIVDRFTKMAHFFPFKEKGFDSPELASVFRQIFKLHGIPTDITCDRGPIFNSQWWRAFTNGLGIKMNFSTAFHPQTDGQTERVNQVLEQYLRMYVDYNQSNWAGMLDLAEFTYNNSQHSSTGHSPFFANYGYHPLHPSSLVNPDGSPISPSVPSAISHLDKLKSLHTTLQTNLKAAQESYSKYYNRKVKDIMQEEEDAEGNPIRVPLFKVGDLVWLNRKNIKTTRPSNKLDHRLLGPFKIIKRVSDLAFTLDLPPTMKIHPTFGVSLLQPYKEGHPGQTQAPPPLVELDHEGQEQFIPERILDGGQNDDGSFSYLVKWEGYTQQHNSWEPYDSLKDTEVFKAYQRLNQKAHPDFFPKAKPKPRLLGTRP
jgi:hypothetical protein